MRTGQALVCATVILSGNTHTHCELTDEEGKVVFPRIQEGNYKITISFLGYQSLQQTLSLMEKRQWKFSLIPEFTSLDEVVVTASESKGITSSSVIDTKAMQHLQPSSFTDLLELLPGGMSQTPKMGAVNLIRLREVQDNIKTNFDISSLGTSFVMDGVPMSADGTLNYIAGVTASSGDMAENKNLTGKGIDMRTISTDQIEKVEVVRGIPSVEYGDLTSGLVIIKRKQGNTPWESRFKADGYSKLLYLGKGFFFSGQDLMLNTGIDYLDSKIDPRNTLENYKRLTASVRLSKKWDRELSKITWDLNLDYGGSFDNEKIDPDINRQKEDSYRSSSNKYSIANNIEWKKKDGFFRSLSLTSSLNLQENTIERVRSVSMSRLIPILDYTDEGVHDAKILPAQYLADLRVDDRPVDAFLKLMSAFSLNKNKMNNQVILGAEWRYNKNRGDGQVYDPDRPPYPSTSSLRPRPYNDIPASRSLSFFAEERMDLPIGRNHLLLSGGIRSISMLNVGKEYTIDGKFYLDPRLNMQWKFPDFRLAGYKLEMALSGGIGWHTKLPVLAHLYPNDLYADLIQLNYYHNNPAYRRINVLTYKLNPVNYELEAARNKKYEIKIDVSYHQNRLSVTYFKEEMTSGFRSGGSNYSSLPYKKYDITSASGTSYPELDAMTFVADTALRPYNVYSNGSKLFKEGIEYQFSSRRISSLHTRVTVYGAWFRTLYQNSTPEYKKTDKIIGGEELQYIGIYDWDDGYDRSQFNTNFMFDTYLPKLDFEFSTTFQCMWYTSKRTLEYWGTPVAYIDKSGNEHPYTEADKYDARLQWLSVDYRPELFERETVPFYMNVNLKASKNFKKKLRLSLFVNNILTYYPEYERKGYTIRRKVNPPYFGMELNFTI